MPDKEKIIECLQKAKMVIETWVPMFEQYNTPAGIDEAIALLKEQPEIVHCEECNKYDQETGRCANKTVHGNAKIWFCADGEREPD